MKGTFMKMSRRTAAIAGSIAALAVTGTLIAGPAIAHDRGGRGKGPGMSDMGHMKGGRGGHMGGPRGGMLYGDITVRQRNVDANGNVTYTYVKQRMQIGTVSAATDAAVTLKSADGYTLAWNIASTTKVYRNGVEVKGSAFVVGEHAHAVGTIAADGTVTTLSIISRTPRAPKAGTSSSGANA